MPRNCHYAGPNRRPNFRLFWNFVWSRFLFLKTGDVIIFDLGRLKSCIAFIGTRAVGIFHARATIPFSYIYPSSCHQLVVTVHKYRWKKKKKETKRWNHQKRISFLSNRFVQLLNEEINPWGGGGRKSTNASFHDIYRNKRILLKGVCRTNSELFYDHDGAR